MPSLQEQSMNDLKQQSEEAFLNRFEAEHLQWARLIGQELIKGDPLSEDELAERLQITPEKIHKIIEDFHNVERNDAGKIVGFAGFTLRPTRHHCRVGNQDFYVWCAGDSLGFPVLLDETVEIESVCPATNQPIQLTVTPDKVEKVTPEDAVVSVVIPDEMPKDVRAFYCNRVNFFKSEEVAESWDKANDDGLILPVEEAFQYYRQMTHRILNK